MIEVDISRFYQRGMSATSFFPHLERSADFL